MTISTTTRKAGPFIGSGSTASFPFAFKVFTTADVYVVRTNSASGVDTALSLGTDYTVTLNANQNTAPGGTVTLTGGALASGFNLTITSAVEAKQPVDLTNSGGFFPAVVTNALDRLTILVQQALEQLSRSLKVSVSTPPGVRTTLPSPVPFKLIGWNEVGDGLQNMDATTLATIVAFGTAKSDLFTGNGAQTQFTLSANPGALANLRVAQGAAVQRPGVDYTWSGGTTLTMTTPVPNGVSLLVQYMQALPQGSSDSAASAFIQSGAGAVQRMAQDKLRDTINARDFGATGSGSDETAKVQLALSALPAGGGDVVIPAGVKFNLKSLTFPAKANLIYRAGDDLSTPGPGFDIGSGEWVNLSVNSSYPADGSGGAVNEWRFSAPFHPGIVVDARKDVTGGNSGLAPGQTLDEPVRASVNLFDEQTDAGRLIYEHYASGSNFSMLKLHAWRRVITLNGIGTAQWVSVPAEGTMVTGQTSGARGFVLSVSAGATTLLWFGGKFVAGERLIDNNETTTATVTSVSYSLSSMAPLAQGLKRGNWAIGLPADAVRDAFVVGGKIGTQKDRSPTFYVDEAITAPGFVWVDSYENATPNGYEIVYDTVPAAASRRLTLRRYNGTADIGHVGAIAGHCTVADSGTAGFRAGGFNFATVVRGGSTGRYDFTFTTPLATANYRVMLSSQFAGHLSFDLKTTAGFSVFVTNASGAAQWAPYDFDVLIVGGDI